MMGTPGYAVVGHAGGQVEIDFPIRLAGEIDGTAYLERDGERRPRRNLKLELLDAQDVVAQTLRSSFDGYFLFEGVLPGRYRIRVASSAIQDPGIQAAEIDLEVPAYGGAVSGLELILRATGEAASATKTMPQQKAKPERKAEPERTRRESPSDEDGPICSPLARVLLKRRAWAPRGSVEVGECLRARRQAEDAGEQVIETRESTEEHRQPQTEEHSESQTLDEGDPQGPPLGTILTPARDERTSKAQERMGIRDLRSAQGLLGGNPCIVQPSDMGDNDESSCRPPSLPPRSHGNRLPPDERRAEGRDYGHFKTRASVALSMEPAEARARAPPRIRSNKVPSM